MLASRKQKKDEPVHECYLTMRELAARGTVEDDALIHYIIDGIKGDSVQKIMLYGANNLAKFKDRLRVYDDMQKRNQECSYFRDSFKAKGADPGESTDARRERTTARTGIANKSVVMRCFNCGNNGHKSRDCRSKSV